MSPRRPSHQLYVQCLPGLEHLLEAELRSLGPRTGRRFRGGIEVEGTTRQLYLVNQASRLATRVLLRVARFDADSFSALERGVSRVDWSPWIGDQRVVVRAAASSSELFHTDAIAERVTAAIGGGGRRPGQRVHVRVHNDRVTLSIDASGDALHHRGWRDDTAKAPLRATLAAALLEVGGYQGQGPLVDPFCGAGTIAIEGARLARDLPPGVDRRFAFHQWPSFEPGTWASVAADQSQPARFPVIATDRDAGAVRSTEANATRAGVTIETAVQSISELEAPAPGPGWLVTNPPYGKRVAADELRNLYARFGQVVRARMPGWRVVVLTNDVVAAGHADLPFESRLACSNGGIDVQALVAVVPG
ncbi:MAG: THUMP domain-containing class I SAM-dependent RNA methyltransferase [Acidimicrobiales bacterium]